MTKMNRETHHFVVLGDGFLFDFAPVIKELLLERGQSLADKVLILKSLPWEELGRELIGGNKQRIQETVQDYLGILLEKDPWILRNLVR